MDSMTSPARAADASVYYTPQVIPGSTYFNTSSASNETSSFYDASPGYERKLPLPEFIALCPSEVAINDDVDDADDAHAARKWNPSTCGNDDDDDSLYSRDVTAAKQSRDFSDMTVGDTSIDNSCRGIIARSYCDNHGFAGDEFKDDDLKQITPASTCGSPCVFDVRQTRKHMPKFAVIPEITIVEGTV